MRIAVFSDVHGNIQALNAVLADMDERGPFDTIVFAGDLVFGAADPQACVNAVRERNIPSVYGNTDEFLWAGIEMPDGLEGERLERWQAFVGTVEWTLGRLDADSQAWLKSLPFELRFNATSRPIDDLLVVHANPKNVSDVILPNRIMQRERMGEIKQEDDEVAELLLGVTARTIAFGHVHVPNVREVDDYLLVNIASASRPQDDDWRCKYGVLTFEQGVWTVEHIHVEYDVKAARNALMLSDMPGREQAIDALLLPPA
jgi:predicted phosphodiesterase